MLEAISRTQPRHYFGIFVLACATLAYQILITRFFSVMLYYHFAFAAISLAMFGLTRGAMQVNNDPERYAPGRVGVEFARHAATFALAGVAAMLAFLLAPLVVPADYVWFVLPVLTLAFVSPFTQSGVCITLLLTRLPYSGGRIYAADLCGAAIGCLGIILILFLIDPVSATLWIAAFAAGAGWFLAEGSGERRVLKLAGGSALGLGAAALLHTALYASGGGHIGVFWAKGEVQANTLYENWNTFSRVRVKPLGESAPFGWGMAHETAMKVDQHYLDIDADAATVITRVDGEIGKLTYLRDDVINAAYLVQPVGDVAVVGVGGGRDILSALFFGAKKVTGVEINPAIFEVLTQKFADFAGRLHERPGVSLVNAEARSYINHSPDRHDLIQISLIDTWAATAAGGLTLTENRLYTIEAFEDFYRALNPGGMLSVSRWYNPASHKGEFYRLVAIAAEALQRQGVAGAELPRHVLAVNVGNIVNVITRPRAFSDAEWASARAAIEAQGFKILLGPGIAYDQITTTLMTGQADEAFFRSLPDNITPSTDDKPFFFYTSRLGEILSGPHTLSFNNNIAVATTLLLVVGSFLACILYIAVPFFGLARQYPIASLARPVAYFSAIGMGFMLVEISQMQRLMVFLGHPVYGLAVVLFTLLLFSGLGSMTVRSDDPPRSAMLTRALVLLVVLLVAGALTPLVTEFGRTQATGIRIVLSVLLLAPPAFLMGMMFPVGLGIWRKSPALLPFFWSANGITSVFASVLGMALSMEIGIARTYAFGVLCYVVCALMMAGSPRAVLLPRLQAGAAR